MMGKCGRYFSYYIQRSSYSSSSLIILFILELFIPRIFINNGYEQNYEYYYEVFVYEVINKKEEEENNQQQRKKICG